MPLPSLLKTIVIHARVNKALNLSRKHNYVIRTGFVEHNFNLSTFVLISHVRVQ